MRQFNYLAALAIVAISFFSCAAPVLTYNVQPINETVAISSNSVMYALPKTEVTFDITVQKNITTAGRFSQYAGLLLELKNVPQKNSTSWNIKEVNSKVQTTTDKAQYFVIQGEENAPIPQSILNASCNNLIIPLNTQINPTEYTNNTVTKNSNRLVDYGEFSYNGLNKSKTITVIKEVLRDTSLVRIPILKEVSVMMSEMDKAEVAAENIYTLRKRRFQIATMNYEEDIFPGESAAKAALDEINKLEAYYIMQFMGYTKTEEYTYNYKYTPDNNEGEFTLFRFSEKEGIVPNDDLTGKPVTIELNKLNTLEFASQFMEKSTDNTNRVIYRIPDIASLEVFFNNNIIFEQEIPVYQFGEYASFPINFNVKGE